MAYNYMNNFSLVKKCIEKTRGMNLPGALGKLDKLDEEQLGLFLFGIERTMTLLYPLRFFPCYGNPLSRAQFNLLYCAANYDKESITAESAAYLLSTDVQKVLETAQELSQKRMVEKIKLKRGDDPKKAEIKIAPYTRKTVEDVVGLVFNIMNSAVKDFTDEELAEYIRLQNKFLKGFSDEEIFLIVNRAL